MRSLKSDFEVRRHILILKRGYPYNKIRLANWFIFGKINFEDIIKVLERKWIFYRSKL